MVTSEHPSRLVLWDVDKTLIDIGPISDEIYREVFEAVMGRPVVHVVARAGRTDPEIALDTLARHGIADPGSHLDRVAEILVDAVRTREALIRRRGRALPGAEAALAAVAGAPGVVQSVLTGNVRDNAIAKLALFGLDRYMDFDVGAYGSDNPVRASWSPSPAPGPRRSTALSSTPRPRSSSATPRTTSRPLGAAARASWPSPRACSTPPNWRRRSR